MRNKVNKSTRHFCEGKGMARTGHTIVTIETGSEERKAEQFKSVRLAKFFMRTGRRAK